MWQKIRTKNLRLQNHILDRANLCHFVVVNLVKIIIHADLYDNRVVHETLIT